MNHETHEAHKREETLADIVAEMRDISKADKYTVKANPELPSPTVLGKPICAYFAEVVDRLEAAAMWERVEVATKAALEGVRLTNEKYANTPVGNAAAMREALEKCRDLAETIWQSEGGEDVSSEICELKDRIAAALAAPARNCDKYSHDEALRVWAAEKENERNGCFDEWLYDCDNWLAANDRALMARRGGEPPRTGQEG